MTNSFRAQKKFIDIDGRQLAYIEKGSGDPIVLLHGNPTSSYLWRNVIPELEGKGRVIVPDLIGQGDSEKLPPELGPERYSFATAYQFLDRMLSALGVDRNVTLVLHDWGSGLGFHCNLNTVELFHLCLCFGRFDFSHHSICNGSCFLFGSCFVSHFSSDFSHLF